MYIHSYISHLLSSANKFLYFVHVPYRFSKIAIHHSNFVHVAFASMLVFQTFDRIIFGRLNFPGTRRRGTGPTNGTRPEKVREALH